MDENMTKVLIVEDDHLVSEMIKGMLEEHGYEIAGEAEDGHNAVEMTRLLNPDVIIMDIKMPRMSGIEAALLVQKHFPTPVVILSAYETVDLARKASEAGVGAYVVKPPKPMELVRAIEVAIARFKDMQQLRKMNRNLQKALDKNRHISDLPHLCSSCMRIRGEDDRWYMLKEYLAKYPDAFKNEVCPMCQRELDQNGQE